jgi:hypothetical protein
MFKMMGSVCLGFAMGIALCFIWLTCRLLPQSASMEQQALRSKVAREVRLQALMDGVSWAMGNTEDMR